MRSSTRYEPTPERHAIEGLSSDTSLSPTTQERMAEAALAAAWGTDIPDISRRDPMMTIDLIEDAKESGRAQAEHTAETDFQAKLVADLRHPGITPVIPPATQGKIDKLTKEISDSRANHPAMKAKIAVLAAGKIPGTFSEEEVQLATTIRMEEERNAIKEAEIRKLIRDSEPLNDPFSRAKRQAEVDPLPTARQAFRWGLGGRPDQIGAAWRESKDARSRRGLTEKQQRASDRHRVAMGEEPIHGTGVKPGKAEKDAKKSAETSYNKLARNGTVIELGVGSGDYMFVQDVSSEGAMYTQPNGNPTELYYTPVVAGEDPLRVQMDEAGNILMRGPGKTPKACIITGWEPDPALPGRMKPITKDVDLNSKQVKENIHQGEEMVTLGKLFTTARAKEILIDGTSSEEVAPLKVRLDDLVAGLYGNPDERAVILDEEDRRYLLSNSLTWQYIEDVYGNRIVRSVDTRVPIRREQHGHFVRPFSYPEQRRASNVQIAREARRKASESTRAQELDGARPPKRKKMWWN